ncbi:Protein gts1 [Saitoella coloradoensis]
MGTHISKVKSISLDTWTPEQLNNMKELGNEKSNAIWNPDGKAPPYADEGDDSAIERYIRDKYEKGKFRRDRQSPLATEMSGVPYREESRPSRMPPSNEAFSDNIPPRQASQQASTTATAPAFQAQQVKATGQGWGPKLLALKNAGFPNPRQNLDALRMYDGDVERAKAYLSGGQPSPVTAQASTNPFTDQAAAAAPVSNNPFPSQPVAANPSNPFPSHPTGSTVASSPSDLFSAFASPTPSTTTTASNPFQSSNPFPSQANQQAPPVPDKKSAILSLYNQAPVQPMYGYPPQQQQQQMYAAPQQAYGQMQQPTGQNPFGQMAGMNMQPQQPLPQQSGQPWYAQPQQQMGGAPQQQWGQYGGQQQQQQRQQQQGGQQGPFF